MACGGLSVKRRALQHPSCPPSQSSSGEEDAAMELEKQDGIKGTQEPESEMGSALHSRICGSHLD